MGKKVGSKFESIVDRLKQANEEALLADGFEDALIGIAEIFTRSVALYDKRKCIEILMLRDSMSYDEAVEFFEFNVQGGWHGPNTPAFADLAAH